MTSTPEDAFYYNLSTDSSNIETTTVSEVLENKHNFTFADIFMEQLAMTLNIYYTPLLIILGCFGNLLSIVVFFKSRLRLQSTSQYLSALAMSDTLFLCQLVPPWLNAVGLSTLFSTHGYCQLFVYLSYVTCYLSSWLVVAFTVERLVAVVYPLRRNVICTVKRARYVIGSLTVVALLVNAPVLRFTVITGNDCHIDEQLMTHAARFNMIDTVVSFTVPLALIIALNAWIMWCVCRVSRTQPDLTHRQHRPRHAPAPNPMLRDATHGSQRRVTRMLLIVSTVFVLFNLPAYTMRIVAYANNMSENEYSGKWAALQQVCLMLFNTNFGINFILYCLTGQNFRRTLQDTIPCLRRTRHALVALRDQFGDRPSSTSFAQSVSNTETEATTNFGGTSGVTSVTGRGRIELAVVGQGGEGQYFTDRNETGQMESATPTKRRQRYEHKCIQQWKFHKTRQQIRSQFSESKQLNDQQCESFELQQLQVRQSESLDTQHIETQRHDSFNKRLFDVQRTESRDKLPLGAQLQEFLDSHQFETEQQESLDAQWHESLNKKLFDVQPTESRDKLPLGAQLQEFFDSHQFETEQQESLDAKRHESLNKRLFDVQRTESRDKLPLGAQLQEFFDSHQFETEQQESVDAQQHKVLNKRLFDVQQTESRDKLPLGAQLQEFLDSHQFETEQQESLDAQRHESLDVQQHESLNKRLSDVQQTESCDKLPLGAQLQKFLDSRQFETEQQESLDAQRHESLDVQRHESLNKRLSDVQQTESCDKLPLGAQLQKFLDSRQFETEQQESLDAQQRVSFDKQQTKDQRRVSFDNHQIEAQRRESLNKLAIAEEQGESLDKHSIEVQRLESLEKQQLRAQPHSSLESQRRKSLDKHVLKGKQSSSKQQLDAQQPKAQRRVSFDEQQLDEQAQRRESLENQTNLNQQRESLEKKLRKTQRRESHDKQHQEAQRRESLNIELLSAMRRETLEIQQMQANSS